jgi:plasmid stabilization system protein ParE
VPTLVVRAHARREIDDVFEWYRVRSPDAAADFLVAIDNALAAIVAAPEHYPVVRGRLRRVLLAQFPYAVYFKVYPHVLSVVGVIHGNRHPDTWLSRAAP